MEYDSKINLKILTVLRILRNTLKTWNILTLNKVYVSVNKKLFKTEYAIHPNFSIGDKIYNLLESQGKRITLYH